MLDRPSPRPSPISVSWGRGGRDRDFVKLPLSLGEGRGEGGPISTSQTYTANRLFHQRAALNYGLNILSRIAAAVIGGYALATLSTLALAYLLPGGKGPALLTGMMLSFLIYAAFIIWTFASRSVKQVWISLGVIMVPLALIFLLFDPGLAP